MPLLRPIVLAAGAAVVLAAGCGGDTKAPRIADAAFTRAAERVCVDALPRLRPDLKDETTRSEAEIATTIDERVVQLAAIATRLRALPTTVGARPEVNAWLDHWDAYVAGGRRYARALRGGNPRTYTKVANEARVPLGPLSAFARANAMPSCALDGVPLPPRDSPI